MGYFCGIDLGGTKIEGIILELSNTDDSFNYEIVSRIRVPTEQNQGYQHILENIKKLVNQLENESSCSINKIGIGTPGIIDSKTELLKNSNTQCLNKKPLKKDLCNLLNRNIDIANDANCFALAEHLLGAAKGAKSSFGVIMGTGVGGGVVINNQIFNGSQGIAGEWGHIVSKDDGNPCYCGLNGCVETLISGPALEKFYESKANEQLSLKDILKKSTDDTYASQTLEHLHYYFGKSLAKVLNIFDPEMVVLGGGLSNIESLYTEGIKHLEKFVFNTRLETKIVKNKLGDSAGVFGAALLALDSYSNI